MNFLLCRTRTAARIWRSKNAPETSIAPGLTVRTQDPTRIKLDEPPHVKRIFQGKLSPPATHSLPVAISFSIGIIDREMVLNEDFSSSDPIRLPRALRNAG